MSLFANSTSLDDFSYKINELRQQINTDEIDSLEMNSLNAGLEVAMASLEYWRSNYQQWYNATHILQSVPETKAGLVHGVVLEPDGVPLVGASVAIPGTMMGTVTDVDGSFRINMPAGHNQLSISYIGYKTVIVEAKYESFLITMEEDSGDWWQPILYTVEADALAAGSAYLMAAAGAPGIAAIGGTALVGSISYALGGFINSLF